MTEASPGNSAPPPKPAGPSLPRACFWVFVLSLTVRGLWVAFAQVTPIGDHYGYDRSAVHWLETGEYRSNIPDVEYRVGPGAGPRRDALPPPIRAYRTPGYIVFLAALYAAFEHNWGVVAVAQAVLGALTSALIVALAGRLVSRRVGVLAGLLHTFWPTALAYVPVLASDNLAVFLLLVGLNTLVSAHRTRGWRSALAASASGIAGGAMFLTRPVAMFFLPAWLLLAWYDPALRQRRPRNLMICVAGFAVVTAPWFVRNGALGYGLTTISTQGGYALWWGNNWRTIDGGNPAPPRFPGDARLSEIDQHRFFREKAIDWIISNPRRYLELSAVRLARHFGTQADVWAAKYFFPTPRNDELICAVYWPNSYPPEQVSAGRAFENRNRRWHQWSRVFVAPVMLVAVALAFRRPRTFAYTLLPLACYALGLALTVFAGRYRLMSDPLIFIALGALLSDMLFGTREIGWWGGRWVKLALVILAVAGSVTVHATGADRQWYRLPPAWEPNPPYERFAAHRVRLDVGNLRGIRTVSSAACSVATRTDPDGLHCRLNGQPDTAGHPYGGLRIPVRGLGAVAMDLTWHDPENIDAIFVIARGELPADEGTPRRSDIMRWEWHPIHERMVPPAGRRMTYVLTPEAGAAHFVNRRASPVVNPLVDGVFVDELRLLVRVKPATSAGFTLHDVILGVPLPRPPLNVLGALIDLPAAQLADLSHSSTSTCRLRTRILDDGLACELQATPGAEGHANGGIRFSAAGATAFELEMTFDQPEVVDRVFVIGFGPDQEEMARWEWPAAARATYPIAGERGRYTFIPGQPTGAFEFRSGNGGPLAALRLLVRVLPDTTSRFVLHRVILAIPSEVPTSAPAAVPESPEPVEPDAVDVGVPDTTPPEVPDAPLEEPDDEDDGESPAAAGHAPRPAGPPRAPAASTAVSCFILGGARHRGDL